MQPPSFAATSDVLGRIVGGASLELLPGGYALVQPPLTAPLIPARDLRNRWEFVRTAFVYRSRRNVKPSGLYVAARIHYEDPDHEAAGRMGRLAARLLRLQEQRFNIEIKFPRNSDSVDVWLTERRPVGAGGSHLGGETWDNQVYIYSTRAARSSLEWTRTLAHEWGHLTLLCARGYQEPEPDAAGYMGERLFMKWLYEEQRDQPPNSQDGVTLPDMELYYKRQVLPLLARFQKQGPLSKIIDGGRAENMDYYIASAMAFEEAVGAELLGKALFAINDVGPRDLLRAMSEVVEKEDALTIHLPAWIPLPKSSYRMTGDTPGAVALADRPPVAIRADSPTRLDLKIAGWKYIRAASGNIRRLTLKRA